MPLHISSAVLLTAFGSGETEVKNIRARELWRIARQKLKEHGVSRDYHDVVVFLEKNEDMLDQVHHSFAEGDAISFSDLKMFGLEDIVRPLDDFDYEGGMGLLVTKVPKTGLIHTWNQEQLSTELRVGLLTVVTDIDGESCPHLMRAKLLTQKFVHLRCKVPKLRHLHQITSFELAMLKLKQHSAKSGDAGDQVFAQHQHRAEMHFTHEPDADPDFEQSRALARGYVMGAALGQKNIGCDVGHKTLVHAMTGQLHPDLHVDQSTSFDELGKPVESAGAFSMRDFVENNKHHFEGSDIVAVAPFPWMSSVKCCLFREERGSKQKSGESRKGPDADEWLLSDSPATSGPTSTKAVVPLVRSCRSCSQWA